MSALLCDVCVIVFLSSSGLKMPELKKCIMLTMNMIAIYFQLLLTIIS